MKKFSDFKIQPIANMFIGDKIKIAKILNREIKVYGFKIEDSTLKVGTKRMVVAIEYNGERHIIFTGSNNLMQQIQQVPEFPFTAQIEKEGERYEFK